MKKTKYSTTQPKEKIIIKNVLRFVIYFLIGLLFFNIGQYTKIIENQKNYKLQSIINVHNMMMREYQKDKMSVKDKIIYYSELNNFPVEIALKIAKRESQFGKYLYNWEGSSAKGVYQIIDKTWENYCEGDVLNEDDNIKCFIKLYPQHPSWWK